MLCPFKAGTEGEQKPPRGLVSSISRPKVERDLMIQRERESERTHGPVERGGRVKERGEVEKRRTDRKRKRKESG